jgi:hypothetical protein
VHLSTDRLIVSTTLQSITLALYHPILSLQAKTERLVKVMTTRAQEISNEAAIVHRALKRYERNYILCAKFDKAQEMAAMSKGIVNMIAGVKVMVEQAEVRAA